MSLLTAPRLRATSHPRVLVIESVETRRSALGDWLRGSGRYDVSLARDLESARAHVYYMGGRVDLVVTDCRLPGRDGGELIAELLEQMPDLRVLYLNCDDTAVADGEEHIRMPFSEEEFLGRVEELVGRPVDVRRPEPIERELIEPESIEPESIEPASRASEFPMSWALVTLLLVMTLGLIILWPTG